MVGRQKRWMRTVQSLYLVHFNLSETEGSATITNFIRLDVLFTDRYLSKEEKMVIIDKIVATVFKHDRADIFEGSFKLIEYFTPNQTDSERMLEFIKNAIRHRSTEIMRSIIKNKENVQIMKDQMMEDDVPLAAFASAACDVSMIKELIEYGVEFTTDTLLSALKRDDLGTFEYLLNAVEFHDREKNAIVICEALRHQKYNDAFQILKTNGLFHVADPSLVFCAMILRNNPTLDLVADLLGELRSDITFDMHEFLHLLVKVCVKMRRMDILNYINTYIREINLLEYQYYFGVVENDEEAYEFLMDFFDQIEGFWM